MTICSGLLRQYIVQRRLYFIFFIGILFILLLVICSTLFYVHASHENVPYQAQLFLSTDELTLPFSESLWIDESMITTPGLLWIDKLFDAQERALSFAYLLPITRYLAGFKAEIHCRLTKNVITRIRVYSKLIDRYPFEKRYYDRLDVLLLQAESPSIYISEWRQRARYNPEIAPVVARKLAKMGLLWYRKGLMVEAINAYKTSTDLDATCTLYALRLAQLYEFSNRKNQAIRWYLRVLQQETDFPAVLDRVQKLQHN